MEALRKSGDFTQPTMELMEACLEGAIRQAPGRVYMDTWNLDSFRLMLIVSQGAYKAIGPHESATANFTRAQVPGYS